MHIRIRPKTDSADTDTDTDSQLYPMVFRMSRWNYVIAAFTIAVSLFFIWLGFFESEMTIAVLLTVLGIILLGFNVIYIIQVKNAFIELNKDTVRYRKYRRIITFDLNQIYVEHLEDAFFLYSPQHARIDIGSYFTNLTLLHSLLYKHSEENISRINGTPHEEFTGFKSFTGSVSSINKRKQLLIDASLVLLFIGINIYSYVKAPERDLTYHLLILMITGAGYGMALYAGRRRAARSSGK